MKPISKRATNVPGMGFAALLYGVLIIYGSLYPFSGWVVRDDPFAFLQQRIFARVPLPDLLTNVLAYIPFGLTLCVALQRRWRGPVCVFVATGIGFCLSLSIETLQAYLPSRVSSLSDLVANTLGTLAGALCARLVFAPSWPLARVRSLRDAWVRPGRLSDMGLIAIGLWALSQLIPFIPSLDVGNLRHGLAPIAQLYKGAVPFNTPQFVSYLLNFAGLALIARLIILPSRHALRAFFVFAGVVLALKVPIVMRQLSAESLLALGGGVAAAALVGRRETRAMAWFGVGLISSGFLVYELASEAGGELTAFNWVPFRGHMVNPLTGIAAISETIWPAAALAFLARFGATRRSSVLVAWGGGLLLTGYGMTLELLQARLPGRLGDITTVVLMATVWTTYWCIKLEVSTENPPARADAIPNPEGTSWKMVLGATTALTVIAGVFTWVLAREPSERPLNEAEHPKLPSPESLPPISIPQFRASHPRLPHPSVEEVALLQRYNAGFFKQHQQRARGGQGDIESAALTELVQPGTQDLNLLHQRLMRLTFSWRGHEQVKPLAVAYDWLYAYWSPMQREQLRGKLADGCLYVINRIREERLSPYNVYLYNSPFQALVACAIALHRDDPRGEPVMAFTYDLLKNRVLPVWRQIMGKNGGWHEGGEYVGIGIGQAAYEVPAMWREATGEDLFASEPGLRGFVDFLIYRTRPDGTHFRWGDAAAFDRGVPDGVPLALQYRNAAAYSLLRPPQNLVPTAWPWGPLPDRTLLDPASPALPLARLFDGIGLIVARSDWTPDATYVTFKAGDNFWSHSHLDQGAFTIYKGGALAIDSGLYGPKYGDDHHMNYAYQTVAHNAVTVTDPEDTVPAPGKKQPRPIANDGGQRRIGSGWGVEAAPLDLNEWEAKREIYRTASIDEFFDRDGLVVAVSDVTPAYTNGSSGRGTFSARTRRVERLWRVFGYDRVSDVVVVYDDIRATRASFRKRWLLHTLQQPAVDENGFTVTVPPVEHEGRGGGRLRGYVLFPEHAMVHPIGGRGLEFLVDDKNFDEGGQVWDAVRKGGPLGPEVGAWRIEVSPEHDAQDDQFLVVLLPSKLEDPASHVVRRLQSGSRIGCEVASAERITRWWFEPGHHGVTIDLVDGTGTRSFQLVRPASAAPVAQPEPWLNALKRWFHAWR